MWPGVRADPAPGSQAQEGCTWGPAMHVLTFSEGEGKKVSALALWGILKPDNSIVVVLCTD